ncbi:MAG TPA: flagellar basal-body rod protein FlgG [Gemmatimonadaceae bacterium]|nr:flagellar basal-body rod protein FlgG [Gemmatimonadaceae bacterium]
MDPSLRAAASGMMAQQTRTEVISNNLANVNTTGFKRSRAHFEDLLYQTVQGASIVGQNDAGSLPAIQIGRGVKLASVQRLHQQGPVEPTQRPLDLAIEGEGFFQVQLPSGAVGYTRDGTFQISDEGMLVTQQGHTVVPGISFPNDASGITISRTGVVSATRAGDTVELGRIELARFANPAGLLAAGENVYTQTAASGDPVLGFAEEDGMGRILQGYLEGSNVEIVQEMVDMITSLRAYEINSKAIKNSEEMMQIASGLLR